MNFVASYSCLLATTFNCEIPTKSPRSLEFKQEIAVKANLYKLEDFVPNEEKANKILAAI